MYIRLDIPEGWQPEQWAAAVKFMGGQMFSMMYSQSESIEEKDLPMGATKEMFKKLCESATKTMFMSTLIKESTATRRQKTGKVNKKKRR